MYVISAHQRYRQTDGQTDAKRWHDRSIAILAWSGKNCCHPPPCRIKQSHTARASASIGDYAQSLLGLHFLGRGTIFMTAVDSGHSSFQQKYCEAKIQQIHLPRWTSLRCSPDPLIDWGLGRGYSPIPHPTRRLRCLNLLANLPLETLRAPV